MWYPPRWLVSPERYICREREISPGHSQCGVLRVVVGGKEGAKEEEVVVVMVAMKPVMLVFPKFSKRGGSEATQH